MIDKESTPKIKWRNFKTIFGSSIARMMPSTGEMIDSFIEHGLLQTATGNYSIDVHDMCRNGATWLGVQLASTGLNVEIVEGTFMGFSHCWCAVEDTYIDTTIAQVNSEYPELAVVYSHEAKGYIEFLRFPISKWLEKYKND